MDERDRVLLDKSLGVVVMTLNVVIRILDRVEGNDVGPVSEQIKRLDGATVRLAAAVAAASPMCTPLGDGDGEPGTQ